MNKRLLSPDEKSSLCVPDEYRELFATGLVYDSSCSKAARVYYIDRDGGIFVKSAPAGTLRDESVMTSFLHSLSLSVELLDYRTHENDWLITRAARGEDATEEASLSNPKMLCIKLAKAMHRLHSLDISTCPIQDNLTPYRELALYNFEHHLYSEEHFPDNFGYVSPQEAHARIDEHGDALCADTLIHGDFCLPNVIFNGEHFSSFIDVGDAGVSDKHIDIFWCLWSLSFNLKTDSFTDYFLDAYGRDLVDREKLRTVAAFEVFR